MPRFWMAGVLILLGLGLLLWKGILPGSEALRLLLPGGEAPEEGAVRYGPVELPRDIRARLVVHDFPWPHRNPIAERNVFRGERPVLWEDRLASAVAAFRRQYPHVEVEVRVLPFAPAAGWPAPENGENGGEEARPAADPDVMAVWWHSPLLDPGRVVPIDPYLTEDVRARYHPLAWMLMERNGRVEGWPRWIAFHYWLGPPGDWAEPVERGWTVADAISFLAARKEAGESSSLLVPPDPRGLLLELSAVPPRGAEPGSGEPAGEDPPPRIEEDLAEALERLRDWVPPREDPVAGLSERWLGSGYGLGGGIGPALGYRLTHRPGAEAAALLPPPVAAGAPTRVPVLSAGSYAVLRKTGPDEAVRAQLAVELARHLAEWRPEEAVAQLLAFPAFRPSLEPWRETAGDVGRRLLEDAAYAGSFGFRLYGFAGDLGRADPLAALSLAPAWREGDLHGREAVRRLFPFPPGSDPGRN